MWLVPYSHRKQQITYQNNSKLHLLIVAGPAGAGGAISDSTLLYWTNLKKPKRINETPIQGIGFCCWWDWGNQLSLPQSLFISSQSWPNKHYSPPKIEKRSITNQTSSDRCYDLMQNRSDSSHFYHTDSSAVLLSAVPLKATHRLSTNWRM